MSTYLVPAAFTVLALCLVSSQLKDNKMVSKSKMYTVAVGDARPGETAPRRNIGAKNEPWDTPGQNPELSTIHNLVQWASKTYAKHDAMGSRKIVKIHDEQKMVTKKVDGVEKKVPKTWQFFELSPYTHITYTELAERINDLGAGLIQLGIKHSGEERVHLYAQTCAEWMQTALSCAAHGIPIVTAYDTLGEEGLTHSMVQTSTVAVLVDNTNLHTLPRPLEKATSVRIIIYREDMTSEEFESNKDIQKIKETRPDIKIISFNEVVRLGKENPCDAHPPKPDDLAFIMYTSGSTGTPKGVVLKNKTVIAGIAGVTGNIGREIIGPGDKILAFLPLAHIFEFTLEMAAFYWGATLGYGNPRTLTDTSCRNCLGDIREYRPTIMVGVPTVWENVKKGVLAKIKASPALVQKIFWASYTAKVKLGNVGIKMPFVDSLIFKKVKDATGGRVRYVMNGGAALSKETQIFISTLIAPLLIGYGLTETNANTTLMTPGHFEFGTQGELTHAVTVKLVDVEDAGYFAKNGQGEVWVKGTCVAPEYFENEKETSEAFTDGWFKTGDIGEWTPSGALRLIDRKKNLVKTAHGEYIALEKLESIYRGCPYVSNICVYADSDHVKPIAIIVPMEKPIEDLCKSLKVDHHDDVAKDPKILEAVHKALLETGRQSELKPVELLGGVVISEHDWTPQNGFVTSAQKLQRKKIFEDNKDEIMKSLNSQ